VLLDEVDDGRCCAIRRNLVCVDQEVRLLPVDALEQGRPSSTLGLAEGDYQRGVTVYDILDRTLAVASPIHLSKGVREMIFVSFNACAQRPKAQQL
jgi:hypothetical protein